MIVVSAELSISSRKKTIKKAVKLDSTAVGNMLKEIEIGDIIKLKGLMPLRVSSISTVPLKDIMDNYTLKRITLHCTVGEY